MIINNNAIRTKRELLTIVAKLLFEDKLIDKIDRIPIERFPKDGKNVRCCIYKDRAVTKYRLMALLGISVEEETDELKMLSEYAKEALERNEISSPVLTVNGEACSSCIQMNYFVTDACKGCVARPCIVNCPKNAIEIRNGKAHIDSQKCVNCGLCMKVCPYHAIIYIPIPCEEVCPVGAISKDKNGKEQIDFEKCIYCGKCIVACPFGAIMEKSQIIDVVKNLKSNKRTIALVAPALMGQFQASPEKIAGAIIELGFDEVCEVALGADITAEKEAREFEEMLEKGQSFMTSSCCPSYTETVNKHIPELKNYVSTTKTPMHYAGKIAKEKYPDYITVFIGPCVAKRNEALNDKYIDYVLSIEELGALFMAKNIDVAKINPYNFKKEAFSSGRGFPVTGGVTEAVKSNLKNKDSIKPILIDGLNKQNIRILKTYTKKPPQGNFIEVMACEGGCVGGVGVLCSPKLASNKIKNWIKAEK